MDIGLVLSRFIHFASTMTLFGACFYVAVLAPASLASELSSLMRRWGPTLALLSLASAVAWFFFVAHAMADGNLDLASLIAVALDTSFGWVWQLHLVLLALTFVAALRPSALWRLPALASGLTIASLALTGHAAMQDGTLGVAHRFNHALHLMLTSAWLGGLLPFFASLGLYVGAQHRRDALAGMMRYSRAGHFFVPAVLVTGALDVAMTTRAIPWPPISPYRIGLWSKIAVFALMTVLALVNRYVFAVKCGRELRAAHALAVGAILQVGLALSAVAIVSAFATFDPT